MKKLILFFSILPSLVFAGDIAVIIDMKSSILLNSPIGQKHVALDKYCDLFIMSSYVSQVGPEIIEGRYSTANNGRPYVKVQASKANGYFFNISCSLKYNIEKINSLLDKKSTDIFISNKVK